MDLVPEHRALLAVDVVGSASNPGYYLNPIRKAVDDLLRAALDSSGIERSEVLEWEPTGDGALLTLPSGRLGTLLDLAQRLDTQAAERNRSRKPDVRLRVAVELGPVGDQPGYYAPKISLTRLLNAETFKRLFERCMHERTDDSVNTGLIVSEQAFRSAFSGDHTQLARRSDFAEIPVQDKEFAAKAWVHVPGFDPLSITGFAQQHGQPAPERSPQVHNQVNGSMNGIQAGTINGGIVFGAGPR